MGWPYHSFDCDLLIYQIVAELNHLSPCLRSSHSNQDLSAEEKEKCQFRETNPLQTNVQFGETNPLQTNVFPSICDKYYNTGRREAAYDSGGSPATARRGGGNT